MPYLSLYRKYRPRSFAEVVGQRHVTQTLANAIKSSRIAHAYLFTGPRGTGKTSTARVLAMALNCEEGTSPEPCGVCESCRRTISGAALDVIEIDAASNRGIDEIRDLRDRVGLAPARIALQSLHRGRSPHAHRRGFQRLPQDPRRAAPPRRLRPRHHRTAPRPAHHSLPLPALRLPPHWHAGTGSPRAQGRRAGGNSRWIRGPSPFSFTRPMVRCATPSRC